MNLSVSGLLIFVHIQFAICSSHIDYPTFFFSFLSHLFAPFQVLSFGFMKRQSKSMRGSPLHWQTQFSFFASVLVGQSWPNVLFLTKSSGMGYGSANASSHWCSSNRCLKLWSDDENCVDGPFFLGMSANRQKPLPNKEMRDSCCHKIDKDVE